MLVLTAMMDHGKDEGCITLDNNNAFNNLMFKLLIIIYACDIVLLEVRNFVIKKNLFKKLSATLLGIFISFSCVEASASFQTPNVVGFIPVGREFRGFIWGQERPATTNNPGFAFNLASLPIKGMKFIQAYQRLVAHPLFNLRDSFTRRVGFEIVEDKNTEYETTRIHVFSDNNQAIGFAAQLNDLMHDIANALGSPLAEVFVNFRSGLLDNNEFDRRIEAFNTQQNMEKMNEINAKIDKLTRALNEIPEGRPTEEDIKTGRCVDSGLDDL